MISNRLKRVLLWTVAVAGVVACGIYGAYADDSTTLTEYTHNSIRMYKFTWSANGVGTASGPTLNVCDGRIQCVVQIPGTGAVIPSDNYDMVITTAQGDDVLGGQGANISNAAASYKNIKDGLGCVSGSILTLSVTNAGGTGDGVTIVYIR